MTVLVTGATGFVGSAVARRLLAEGLAVRTLVRRGTDRRNLEGLDVEVVEGDLLDEPSLRRAVAGCEALFHVAADYRLWVPDPERMRRINVDGTRALMLAALDAGVPRIVHTSSVATLGIVPGGVADEETPSTLDDMIGPYKRTKFLGEREVHRLIAERDLPAVIVNPSTPVGPRDIRPTPTGRMIADAAAGRMPAYVDTGLNIVHVDDVAEGHWQAFRTGEVGQRYVLGGENLMLRDILAVIATLVGRTPPVIRLPHRALIPLAYAMEAFARVSRANAEPLMTVDGVRLSQKRMFFSSAKAEAKLGYRPRPAGEALADAVAWFRGR
ncbi:hopanoid-associated sugar epimerase [Azospirillum rugosum]|uniref:Dihydroflavonol-4-reductase n=1 Tax=Azospirillum rugosum TaxID=416170 RepID=A0ABS4SHL1_9PROT|nr:hopanoid-associated sugar epimerase [Azospirillum rugosum]MBP2291679.1 dihydroflavonol-4-reductase [Azospirillum rugosum]MDQ0524509.1 dihydroflavonol-4-reductase [Azospirillum rugosum]